MSAPRWAVRRNAALAGATGVALVWLLLYPTSTSGRASQSQTTVADGASQAVITANSGGLLTVDGPVIATPYGPVQVRLGLRDGYIENAAAVVYPRENLVDKAINDDAVQVLQGQALIEQSSEIDTVSGATHTSAAYRESLQAALDAAHAAPPESDPGDPHGGHSADG
ncbi:FMN-binding protein [Sporichthya sp.]|uniref:FMN-binding protein n=1 Tax=Sporichthya sp. TaxID=65475 RepID=UPI0025EFE72C|nr:FMN-binding protein [Sporichthya sp.]